MRRTLTFVGLLVVSFSASLATAEDAGFTKTKITVLEGEDTKEHDARVVFNDGRRLVIEDRKGKDRSWALDIPFDQIQEITYERSTHPRAKTAIFISPLALLSKSKKHWLTVKYDKGGTTDFVILRLDKNEYQRMIAVAETRTGLEVEQIIEE
jgi:hypothetical protein